jgi:hypothetical protein
MLLCHSDPVDIHKLTTADINIKNTARTAASNKVEHTTGQYHNNGITQVFYFFPQPHAQMDFMVSLPGCVAEV